MSEKRYRKAAVISAMEVELSYMEEFLKEKAAWSKKGTDRYINQESGLEIVTKVLGIGKVNAAYQTADLITQEQPDLIINVGYAGGLVKNARTGDVAIGTEYVQTDFIPYQDIHRPHIANSPSAFVECLEKTAESLNIHAVSGKIATGDFFLHDTEQKKEIIKEFHPIAFDMESGAIAQVATNKQVDFVSLRTFSDLADEDAPDAFADRDVIQNGTKVPIERYPVLLALTALDEFV
jgi:adenosylhomocysteine nucleosidase